MRLTPSSLHVLRVYGRFPPAPGGMEKHILELTTAQRKLGVRVTNLYNVGLPEGEAIQLFAGRDISQLRPTLLREFLVYASAAMNRHRLHQGNIRVVHSHGGWSSFLFARSFANFVGAKALVATVHGHIPSRPTLHRWALKNCDVLFSTGQKEARYFSGIMGGKVIHLPSAPADIFFESEQGIPEIDVITAAYLRKGKNIDLLMQCAKLKPNLRFVVLGDGSEYDRLKAIAATEDINNIELLGEAAPLAVRDAFLRARLYINLSDSEGSPTAALEAMACKLPVLLTPANDYSNILYPGINGFLTKDWSIEGIINGIEYCLDDEGRRRAMGQAARLVAEQHRWDGKASLVTEAMIDAVAKNCPEGLLYDL